MHSMPVFTADPTAMAERLGGREPVQLAKGSKRSRRTLHEYDREKPTKERAARGEYVVVDAAKFDTSRKGEKILLDMRAKAGGAGEMYAKGSINERQLAAAAELCKLHEIAEGAQAGGMALRERVDGGRPDTGARLIAAADAQRRYVDALACLGRASRTLVEQRVVLGRPMEEAVRFSEAVARVGSTSIKRRCELAKVLIEEALDRLADLFQFGGG